MIAACHARPASAAAVITVCLLSASCGNSSLPVYPVNGQVLINGEPAVGAAIAFHPIPTPEGAQNWMVRGGVDGTGKLVVSTYRLPNGDKPRLGAPAGEYIVTVSCSQNLERFESFRDDLNASYGEPEKSALRVTIKPGNNDLEPIHLKATETPKEPKE